MKKTIVGILSFVLLFIGQSAFAVTNSVTWNTASNDCSTISIINEKTDEGYTNPCWGSDPISANPGDYINVRVYYHNTGNSTATNTHIKLNAPSGSSTSHSFTAQITSDQGNKSSSAVRVNISTPQTLTFSRVEWTTGNTSEIITNLLNGQNGSEILSGSGLYIGDIAPVWSTQGSVVVSFKVSDTTPPSSCSIDNFTADGSSSTSITSGDSSSLSWSTSYCTNASISSIGSVSTSGSRSVSPTTTTTYTLTAYGSTGSPVSKSVTVNVNPPVVTSPCSIDEFIADGYSSISIVSGDFVKLKWLTSHCTSATISNLNYNIPVSGVQDVYPTVTTTYTLTAYGTSGGSKTASVTVYVNQPAVCSINSFYANPTSITSGDSSTLSWSTSNCTNASISSIGSISTSGSRSVSPTTTTTYTLTAYGSTGSPVSKSVTVNVNPVVVTSPCSIDEFIADGASSISIVSGDFVKLKWLTSHCTSATISNLNYSIPVSGVQDVYPTVTTTYTLTAYGSTGSPKTASVTVYVNQPAVCSINSFYANPTSITSGDSSSLSWSTSNCTNASISSVGSVSTSGSKSVSPTTTTTYTLTAYGSTGSPKTASVTVYVNQPAVCVINYFTADGSSSTSITSGESATLAWNTSNCTNVAISNLNYNVPTSGTQSVWPTVTTTYKLTANGLAGATQTKSVTVSVNEVTPNCSINSFYASPNSITSGDSSTLVWTTSNCTKATISNLNYNVPTSGDQDVWPTTTTTYTLTAYGSTGSPVSKSVKVNVTSVAVCSINNFTADGSSSTSITSGESATLAWNTSNCTNASISSVGSVSTSGSRSVSPTTTTTYTLTAYGSTGSPKTASVTVYVNQPAVCSINSFYANPTSITSGDSSSLYWSTDNCTRVTISNLNYNVPTSSISGGQSIWPTTTTTYVLTAYGSSGSTKTASATVYVNNVITSCVIDSFYASDYSINEGDSTTLRWETTNCQNVKISNIGSVSDDGSRKVYPDNDITYTLTAYDSNGNHRTKSVDINVDEEDDDDNDNCSIDKFSASDSYIDKGDSVELKWNTTNCDDVSITDLGDVSDDGKETVYPHTTTTYKLRASGNNGNTKTKTLKINVGDEQQYTYYNTNVITTVATNISQNGAQVNGLITSSNYTNANVYFEYGTTVNLGMRTSSYSTNGNTNFSDYLTNLSPNTIYYFQAVSSGANGISRGAIEVFRTTGYTTNYNNYYNYDSGTTTKTVRQIVVQGETVYGSESPVILRIENRYQTVSIGDTIDYTVYYKNISSSTLHDPMIQVYIPEGVILTNSSHGTYSEDDRILSVPIDDLIPGEEGFLYLQAEVESIDVSLAQIVTTAVIIYTNPSGSQNNAMAYVLNNPKLTNNNALGASAFFSGLTNIGLIGWLLIIIFIMLIILIARSLYNRKGEIVMVPTYIEKNRQ